MATQLCFGSACKRQRHRTAFWLRSCVMIETNLAGESTANHGMVESVIAA
jgi:hypothetical protein